MYLEHFGMKELPFSLSPNTDFYCDLPGHQAAYNVLIFSLRSGESLIKIVGEVGSGKTLLCRKLLNSLDASFVAAYIPNPDLTPAGIRLAVARELGLEVAEDMNDHTLLESIVAHLISLRRQGKHVVLLIDEAQALSDESLEALRLLTNIETESQKLLQIVLFGQPELDQRLNSHKFRQLKQRITFSHYLTLLDRDELESYLCHRLMIAGSKNAYALFSKKACDLMHKYSLGTPRLINVLSHKAMLVAFGKGEDNIDHQCMVEAIRDTSIIDTTKSMDSARGGMLTLGISFTIIVLFLIYFYVSV